MPKKTRLIPFKMLPGSWGLVGKPFDEAEAHYYLDGVELERRLIEIYYKPESIEFLASNLEIDRREGKVKDYDYEILKATYENGGEINPYMQLDIDLKYKKIDQYTYDTAAAKLDDYLTDAEKEIAFLHIEFKHGKLTQNAFDKQLATLQNEPWVGILKDGYNKEDGVSGFFFEFDWNPQWIEYLRKNGYNGFSDEQTVEQWFSDVCRAQEEEDPDPVPFNSAGRIINRVPRPGGGAEYS